MKSILLKVTYILAALMMGPLSGCNRLAKEPVRITGEAQGTYYAITYFDEKERNFQPQLDSLFADFDQSASVYAKESIISRFNRNDSTVVADSIFDVIFKKSMEVSESTNGAFDITVMPLVNVWGFGFTERSKVDSAMVDSLLPLVGYKKIKLINGKLQKENKGIMIDFNAIAQGFTCDVIGKFFEKRGIYNYLVDVGGEVLAKGNKPDGSKWNVAIEKPSPDAMSAREIQITVPLKNKALATSGSYRAYFTENGQKYSHTIDPKTGFPVHHNVLSVSVLADDCITADAYATAFMVIGLEKTKEFLVKRKDLKAYIIYDENGKLRTWSSEGFL
ncbi:MAG: FAD:protein FMN transferase [Omnitrophica WOR_2 bacterium]